MKFVIYIKYNSKRRDIMSQGRNSAGNELSEFRQSEIKVIVDAAMNEKFKNWKRTITFFAIL